MRKFVIAVFLLTLVIGLAGGVARAATSASPSPDAEKLVFRVGQTQDVDNLNPFIGQSSITYEIFSINYDYLVGSAPNGDPRPGIADSWTVSDDGLTWTFKIHPGIKWQDGQPLTAKDVAFTYNYVIDNKLSAFTWNTTNMKDVVAVDDATVVFHLSKPRADMLRTGVFIVPEHVWSKVPGDKVETYQVKPPLVGSGPFQVIEAKDSYTLLAANKDCFMGAPTIDEVIFEVYRNEDTLAMDITSGAIDVAWGLPAAQMKALQSAPGITARAMEAMYFDNLAMNVYDNPNSLANPVLRDVKFRQAISWAIDKQKLVDTCMGGYATVGQSICCPGTDGAWTPTEAETFGFDLEKAQQMLEDAGYTDTNGDGVREDKQGEPIDLRLWVRSESPPQQRVGKLMAGWFQSIGLKIKLSVMTDGGIYDGLYNYTDNGKTYAPDFDMYIWGWPGGIDPEGMLACFTTSSIESWNECSWSNAQYDALEQQQITEMDWPTRETMVQRMQQIFYQEAPDVVLYYPKSLMAYSDKWEGWVPYPTADGMVVNTHTPDTYIKLHLKAAATTTANSGSSNTALIVGAVIAALAVIAIVLLLVRRSRGRAVEE
jgi:peptide/nickel transport system substrate-binding protein